MDTETRLTLPPCRRCRAVPAMRASGGAWLPRGWRRIGDAALCPTCLRHEYVLRAVTVPIAGPLEATWAELGATLREAWGATTAAANWMVTELYARDIRRDGTLTHLPPMRRVTLYPAARANFPSLAPIHLTSIIQQVERTYREQRYELLWTGRRSLALHRYPVPMPLHAQGWRLHPPDPQNGSMVLDVRLGESWSALRLQAGPRFRRQARELRALQSGLALSQTGALYAIRSHIGDHRHQETAQRVMVKLMGWFPIARAMGTRRLVVSTAISDLFLLRVDGRLVETVHGDELRRVIGSYETRRARADNKLAVAHRAKQAHRIQSVCQQHAAHVAHLARVHHCGVVEYEDEERGFCDPCPWTKLRLWLQSAVERQGIVFTYASGATGDIESLAMSTT